MAIDITPLSQTQVVLKLASKNQEELQRVSIQISSGNKNQDFKGFAEDATTENLLNFKSTLNNIEAHVSSNDSAIARAKTTDSSIKEIQELASDLAALLAQRRNGASGDDIPVDVEAKGILDKIAGKLNIKFDGRFLFSGSKTNTQPVTNIQTSNVDNSGSTPVVNSDYYHGDNDVPSIRSSDSEEVEYGALANDNGFKNLIAAAHLAILGHQTDSDTTLSKAVDLVNTAIDQLTSTRATVLISVERLQKSNASHTDFKLLVQGNLDKISQTDIVQATAELSQLQAIVQAGYLAFSRLSSLRLTDYLR